MLLLSLSLLFQTINLPSLLDSSSNRNNFKDYKNSWSLWDWTPERHWIGTKLRWWIKELISYNFFFAAAARHVCEIGLIQSNFRSSFVPTQHKSHLLSQIIKCELMVWLKFQNSSASWMSSLRSPKNPTKIWNCAIRREYLYIKIPTLFSAGSGGATSK